MGPDAHDGHPAPLSRGLSRIPHIPGSSEGDPTYDVATRSVVFGTKNE